MVLNILAALVFLVITYRVISFIIKSVKTEEIQEMRLPLPKWQGLRFKDYPSLFILCLTNNLVLLVYLGLFMTHKIFPIVFFGLAFLVFSAFIYPTIYVCTGKILAREEEEIRVYTKEEKPLFFYLAVGLHFLFGIILLLVLKSMVSF